MKVSSIVLDVLGAAVAAALVADLLAWRLLPAYDGLAGGVVGTSAARGRRNP
jgi:hypothetical protein